MPDLNEKDFPGEVFFGVVIIHHTRNKETQLDGKSALPPMKEDRGECTLLGALFVLWQLKRLRLLSLPRLPRQKSCTKTHVQTRARWDTTPLWIVQTSNSTLQYKDALATAE